MEPRSISLEDPLISTQISPDRTTGTRLLLSGVCLLGSVILLVGAILPASIWRETIIRSTRWGVWDDEDLRYMRLVYAGFGLIFVLWSAILAWNTVFKHRLAQKTGNNLYRGILITLVLSMGYFLTRIFIVFRDRVRIIGPKTQFSNWGEFLGRTWTVPIQPFTERDYFNSMFLAFAGFICSIMVILRHKGLMHRRENDFPRMLWGLLALGLLWASVDELVMIHEFLGPNVGFVVALHESLGITKYPDDLIMLFYLAAGGFVLLRYFKYFVARRNTFAIFVLGMVFQGLSAVNGVPGLNLNEESFEMYGGLCYFISMFWYAYCEIEESLDYYDNLSKQKL